MKYQNKRTGIIFESDSVCKGEDWVELSPSSSSEKTEEKPKTKRKTNGNSK